MDYISIETGWDGHGVDMEPDRMRRGTAGLSRAVSPACSPIQKTRLQDKEVSEQQLELEDGEEEVSGQQGEEGEELSQPLEPAASTAT